MRGRQDLTIKISDEGGGIPRSGMPKVWTYMYTTAKLPPTSDDDDMQGDFKAPLAGFGYGLPISRLVRLQGKTGATQEDGLTGRRRVEDLHTNSMRGTLAAISKLSPWKGAHEQLKSRAFVFWGCRGH